MIPISETHCVFTHNGASFAASGAWLTPEGGAVYIVRRADGSYSAETWNGDVIADQVQIVSEWRQYSRRGEPYRMRSVRFTVPEGVTFAGRYGSDWAQLCRVKAVRS